MTKRGALQRLAHLRTRSEALVEVIDRLVLPQLQTLTKARTKEATEAVRRLLKRSA